MRPRVRLMLGCAPGALLVAYSAAGQDFAAPQPPGPSASPAMVIESGVQAASPGLAVTAGLTRWFGLPDLVTRNLAVGGGWHSARLAAGISQTGDGELGWQALGIAAGVSSAAAGAAIRAVARRDRDAAFTERVGAELGGGAWVEAGQGLTLWASAPEIWSRGAAPPLARPLEIGVRLGAGDLNAWLARGAPPHGSGGGGEHRAGLKLCAGPLAAWLEARDRPLRGSLGVGVQAGAIALAAAIEGHPVLGETARLSISLGGGAAP